MKSLKLVVSLVLIAVLALSITGCGKDGSLVSKVETYDEPTGGNMKINPMKNVDLNVESDASRRVSFRFLINLD